MISFYSLHLVLIQQILIYGLLALGLQSAFMAGVFSLASVGFFAIGAFGAGALVVHANLNAQVAILVVVVASLCISWIFSRVIRRLSGLYLGMATFAFDFIVVDVVTDFWTKYTGGPVGIYGVTASVSTLEILIVLLVCIAIAWWIERQSAGRAIHAIRLDVPMARSVGVDVGQWQTVAFMLSCLYGAVAGAMYIFAFGVIAPTDVGFDFISLVLTMVVIGGRNSWFGAILGAAILTWLPTVLTFAANWRPLVYGVAIVLVATYAPGGLVGIGQSLAHLIAGQFRSRRAAVPAGTPKPEPAGPLPGPGEPDQDATGAHRTGA
jgi:branched-chain amino acid transport system permease protein